MADQELPWEEWTDENAGFPYYMVEENIKEQADAVIPALDRASDMSYFTPDYPNLALWDSHYLFVYGTLKKSQDNHRVIDNKDCQFVTFCYTADPQFILKQTKAGIPVALGSWGDSSAVNKHIRGELYLVKTSMIPKLDVFEQNGVLYRRLKMRMTVPIAEKEDELVPAWMYVGIKSAWADATDILSLTPSFEREKSGKKYPFYTYIAKDAPHE